MTHDEIWQAFLVQSPCAYAPRGGGASIRVLITECNMNPMSPRVKVRPVDSAGFRLLQALALAGNIPSDTEINISQGSSNQIEMTLLGKACECLRVIQEPLTGKEE